MQDRNIKVLNDQEHIYSRPDLYIGATDKCKISDFILQSDGSVKYTETEIVPGLIKIINEIIDNAIDVHIKTPLRKNIDIDVNIKGDRVIVQDNGRGIPITKNQEGIYTPHICWGFARSGGNFDLKENKGLGKFGVGSYCTNVMSKKFIGITDDGKQRYTIVFKKNATEYQEKVETSQGRGTYVEFYPDLKVFGLTEIDDNHINYIKQRLYDLSISFDNINFRFNNKQIKTNFKSYMKLFDENAETYESDKIKIGVFHNPYDDFKQFSYVNGLKIVEGGIHIDTISKNICDNLKEKLVRKYSNIKPSDIKNKISLVVFLTDFPNPKFNSQTKEKLTNLQREFNQYSDIDYKFTDKIYKNKSIIEPIVEIHKIKEEFANRKALKNVEKVKKIKSEKYFKATKKPQYLCVCEGFSAFGGISQILGNENIGYYVLKGKMLNTYDETPQKIGANRETAELLQIAKNEGYQYIISTTDADLDGNHITALLSVFISKYIPEYKSKFGRFKTPVKMTIKNGKAQKWTYNIQDEIEAKSGETFKYFKGLGTWTKELLQQVIDKDGFNSMIELLEFDDDEIIRDFMSNDYADVRKDYIRNHKFSIAKL